MMTAAAYDIILILPLMLAAFDLACTELLSVPAEMPLPVLLIPLICCAVLISYKHLKNKGRIIISGIILAIIIAAVLGLPAGERKEILAEHIWVARSLIFMTAVFFAADLLNRCVRVRFAVSMAALLSLPIMLFVKFRPGHTAVCMILLYAILNLMEAEQLVSKKKGDTDHVKHLVFVSPFVLVFFILFMFIKVPDEPYDWRIVKRIGGALQELCLDIGDMLFNPDALETEEAFIGFSGKGGFPGKIRGNDGVALNVTTMTENDERLYLAGRIFSEFTGREWEGAEEPDEKESCLDTLGTVCALNSIGGAEMKDMVKKTTIDISYRGLRGRTLFLPPKDLYVRPGEDPDTDDYMTVFYRINRRNEAVEQLLREGCEVDKKDWDPLVRLFVSADISGLGYEDHLAYEAAVRDKYLPDTPVSEELKSYLDELLKDADNDYDKLKLIEGALREGSYSVTPGMLPEEVQTPSDYLDHFVLGHTEGYCTHYATAFVLLSRACGIPARFVQGFNFRAGREKSIDVRSERAHAWPEAYLKGYGWIIFEPTPGYTSDPGWDKPEIIKDERQISMNSVSSDMSAGQGSGEEGPAEDTEDKPVFKWYMVLIPLLSGLGLALLLFAADALLRRRRYAKMEDRDKCVLRLWQCLEMLKKRGFARRAEETLEEYRQRLCSDIEEEKLLFISLYEYIIYSEGEVTSDMVKAAEDHAAELKKLLRDRHFRRRRHENGTLQKRS